MSKIFNDLAYGNLVPTYAGLPLKEAKETADILDTRYRENLDTQDQLEVMIDNLKVRSQNRPLVQSALDKARKTLEQTREKGDWENAGFLVKRAAKDFAMDKGVRAALSDKQQYDSYMEDLDQRLKDDKIDIITYNNSKELASRENKKAVEYDPITGDYKNIFSAYSPQNFQDVQKAAFDMGEKWKASKDPFPVKYQDKNGNMVEQRVVYDANLKGYKIVGSDKYLSESELQSGLRQAVLANPKYKGYIQEGLMFDKALKFGVGDNQRPITMSDIFNGDSGTKSIFNISETEAKDMIEKLGYDYDEIANDPDMIEAIYDQLHMNKAVDGYVNPAASAYSFQEIEEKYLTDHLLLESIKQRNRMALKKYDWNNRWRMHKDGQNFKLKINAPVLVANSSAVTKGKTFNSDAMKKSITQTESALNQAKRELDENKANGKGNANEINRRINDLEFQLKTQKNTMQGYRKRYIQSPQGQSYIDQIYEEFKSSYPRNSKLHMSREEFQDHVLKGNMDVSGRTTVSVGTIGNAVVETEESARNSMINKFSNGFYDNIDDFVKENTPQSWGGEWLQGDGKSYVDKQNKAITTQVLNNRTNYWTGGGQQLDEFINQAAATAGKDGIVVKAVMSTADVNGEFPYGITITNKKTGQTIAQEHLHGKTGGRQERYNTGVALMNEWRHDPNNEFYQKGNYMAASASYPQWKNDDFEGQLSILTDRDDPSSKPVTTEMFVAGTTPNGIPMHFKVEKSRKQFYNNDGTPSGTNTVYKLLQVDPNNPDIVQGSLETSPNSGDNIFYSMDDMKVALFNQQNPNPDINQYQITGYSQNTYSGAGGGVKRPITGQ